MTPQARRSIVWTAIERMAFRPDRPEVWLKLFKNTMHKLWEQEPTYVGTDPGTSFEVPFLSITCAYHVEDPDKYDSSIRLTGNQSRLLFTLHDDPAYASRAAFHNENRTYERQDCARYLRDDVARVLDGMIFHPRIHTHIKEYGVVLIAPPPQRLLDLHEIRIGGGIENAFAFLFHLRYQFCVVSEETRHSERDRLVNLFTTAIKGRETHLSAKELFGFRATDMGRKSADLQHSHVLVMGTSAHDGLPDRGGEGDAVLVQRTAHLVERHGSAS